MLQERFTDITLVMVGPKKDRSYEDCRKYAETNNLPVEFTGKLDKKEWIARSKGADIFINTSNVDNQPVSLIEAMALGLPIVSTNAGGIPFLLSHEEDAVIVQKNDIEKMASAIQELLEEPEIAQTLSEKARRKAEPFDWKNVKQSWLDVLTASSQASKR